MYLQQTSGKRLWRTGIMSRRYDSDSCSSCSSRQVEGGLRLRGRGGRCRRGALLGLRTLLCEGWPRVLPVHVANGLG